MRYLSSLYSEFHAFTDRRPEYVARAPRPRLLKNFDGNIMHSKSQSSGCSVSVDSILAFCVVIDGYENLKASGGISPVQRDISASTQKPLHISPAHLLRKEL
jgi:hypothetical protein